MAQRSTIQSMTGAILSISATRPDTFDQAGYESTDIVWTTIGEVEDHGAHGVTRQIMEFINVTDGAVQKVPGSKNYGVKNVMLGNVPGDAGQILIAAAAEANVRYSVRVEYPLGDGESTKEKHYLDVIVAQAEYQDGPANSIRKLSSQFAICRRPVVVAAT